LAARPEKDEGERGPAVRERKGGRWAGEGGGGLGSLGRSVGQDQSSERVGWARKEKKKEIHWKLIYRFRKMNKEIRVTEIIGKIPIIPRKL
jgi:hypothetical protein